MKRIKGDTNKETYYRKSKLTLKTPPKKKEKRDRQMENLMNMMIELCDEIREEGRSSRKVACLGAKPWAD